jgi:hypothetical protein
VERRLDRIDRSIDEVREWLAFRCCHTAPDLFAEGGTPRTAMTNLSPDPSAEHSAT